MVPMITYGFTTLAHVMCMKQITNILRGYVLSGVHRHQISGFSPTQGFSGNMLRNQRIDHFLGSDRPNTSCLTTV